MRGREKDMSSIKAVRTPSNGDAHTHTHILREATTEKGLRQSLLGHDNCEVADRGNEVDVDAVRRRKRRLRQ